MVEIRRSLWDQVRSTWHRRTGDDLSARIVNAQEKIEELKILAYADRANVDNYLLEIQQIIKNLGGDEDIEIFVDVMFHGRRQRRLIEDGKKIWDGNHQLVSPWEIRPEKN